MFTTSCDSPEFFQMACEATTRHAVNMLRLSGRRFRPRHVMFMLTTAPHDEGERCSLNYLEDSFCYECLNDAYRQIESLSDKAAHEEASRYFLEVLPCLSPPARRLLEAAFRGILPGVTLAEHVAAAETLRRQIRERDIRELWSQATP